MQATAKVGEHPWKRVRRDRPIVEQPALSAIQHQLRAQQVAVGGQRRCGAELGEVEQGNGRRRQGALQGTQGLRLQAPLVGTAQPLTFGPAGQHDQPSTALAGQGHGGSEGGLVVEAQLPLQGHGNGDGTGHGGGTEPAQPGRFSPHLQPRRVSAEPGKRRLDISWSPETGLRRPAAIGPGPWRQQFEGPRLGACARAEELLLYL